MSNMGISTNTFRVTGKYLDLLNDIMVRARIHHGIAEPQKEQLLDFIHKISDDDNTQIQFQLLSSIVERELRLDNKRPNAFFAAITEEINQNNWGELLPKLEFITEALDAENSMALAKIKG